MNEIDNKQFHKHNNKVFLYALVVILAATSFLSIYALKKTQKELTAEMDAEMERSLQKQAIEEATSSKEIQKPKPDQETQEIINEIKNVDFDEMEKSYSSNKIGGI